MVTDIGSPTRSLGELLHTEAFRFDFFQAVRLLHLLLPEREPVGYDGDPATEVVRFRTDPSLASPPSAIRTLEQGEKADTPLQMTVSLLGLTGCSGVLPHHYTAWIVQQSRRKDPEARAFQEFLNVFSHRVLSLLYRAWGKYRFPITYERTAVREEEDSGFTQYLFSLIGMGTGGLRGRLGIPDEALLSCAGLIAQRPRSASALEGILQEFFEVPVQVEQCVGQWLPLEEEQWSRLSDDHRNNVLGGEVVIGARVWSQQSKFRLRLGPLTFFQFCRFLPCGDLFRPLVQLIRFFAGQEFDFDIQLVLSTNEVPECRLSEECDTAPQLGWTSWLKGQDSIATAEDIILPGD